MYVQHNIEARSCNLCCRGISSKYYIFRACVCILRYPACNARAPYWHLWPSRLYNIFPHYLMKGTIKKKLLNIKCAFWFSLQLLSENVLILNIIERDIIMYIYICLHVKCPLFLSSFNEIKCSGQIFKYSNTKFHKNPSSESRIISCGRTDGRTDGQTSRI